MKLLESVTSWGICLEEDKIGFWKFAGKGDSRKKWLHSINMVVAVGGNLITVQHIANDVAPEGANNWNWAVLFAAFYLDSGHKFSSKGLIGTKNFIRESSSICFIIDKGMNHYKQRNFGNKMVWQKFIMKLFEHSFKPSFMIVANGTTNRDFQE